MRIAPAITVVVGLSLGGSAAAGGYLVRPGDTLSGIAARHRVSTAALAEANGLADPNRVIAGTRLTLPGAGPAAAAAMVHVVQPGEHLDGIARRYGTTIAALAKANRLANPSLVRIGARLQIPAGARPVAGSAAGLPARLRSHPERLALMPHFDHWARTYAVPADVLKAMTWVESGWQNGVVSSTGARGIGQLMPATVDFVSRILLRARLDPAVPEHNIRMSARFLRYLLDQNGGNVERALASYYQGLRSVRERGLYDDTRQYVATVVAYRPRFR